MHDATNIEIENMFDLLNHSQHDNDANTKNYNKTSSSIPMTKRKLLLLNGHYSAVVTNDSTSTTTSSRSITPISEMSPFKQTGNGSKMKLGKITTKKRSKSTSPPRKIESSVSKMFRHFDPHQVDWIQKNLNAKL